MRMTACPRRVRLFGLCCASLVLLGAPDRSDARPQYLKQFNEAYPGLKKLTRKEKCNVCHVGGGAGAKANRNNYGKDLAKALGAKNVKNAAAISEALEGIEDKQSAAVGKTYKDLIDAGELPAD